MDITLQYIDDCPNWKTADDHLRALRAELPDLVVTHQLVNTPDEAEAVGFRGSPSILVDGIDPFADPGAPVGLSCRVYQTPDGPAGSPTIDQLRAVLTRA
ncbi:MAG: thioredoxin family protein [Acidimicrobiia bacterium]|nr:thioredoxin family protein [Acidimicrobiia bacterium]